MSEDTIASRFRVLDRLHSSKPFKAFDIITADGRRYHVEHWYEFSFDEKRVVLANEKKSGLYRLSLDTVQSIEEQPTASAQ